jgi:dTDP-4-dehydrorhamnose 3,5-epimerase
MKVIKTEIADVLAFEPKVFGDARGFFMESYNGRVFAEAVGRETVFVQDNHSRSARGVLRGLHFQYAPHAQGKLVRVTSGAVFDVAVDIRRSSLTFGQWVGVELSEDNFRQLWIPPGFAHGFVALSDRAEFLYKTTEVWVKACDRAVRWDDPAIGIDWPLPDGRPPTVAAKDAAAPLLRDADLFD